MRNRKAIPKGPAVASAQARGQPGWPRASGARTAELMPQSRMPLQSIGAGPLKHFHSPLPPYRGEDLRFLSKIEDCDQPSLPIDNMERDIVHKAAGTVRYYRDAEGFQQSAESLLVLRARRDPKTAIRTVRLRIF